jgi:hypothetical protein
MVISRGERTGPTDVLINDRPFLATAVIWVLLILLLVLLKDHHLESYLPLLRYPGSVPTPPP